MQRRGGSLIRVPSPGTARKRCRSPRSGLRQQNHRGIPTSPCRSLCSSLHHLLHPLPPASSHLGSDASATTYTNVELPGSDAETGRVAYSRAVTWHRPETQWIIPIRGAPTEPPRDIYIPMPQSVLVVAPSPPPVAARQIPPRQRCCRHHLHQCRTSRLRSPRALAAN